MRGAKARFDAEAERDIALAHAFASMNAATKTKRGLRPLKDYLPKRGQRRGVGQKQSVETMRANMLAIAARANAVHRIQNQT